VTALYKYNTLRTLTQKTRASDVIDSFIQIVEQRRVALW